MELALFDEARVAALRIPKGKGDGEVEPPLGSTGAAAEGDAGADDTEARGDEAVAPLAVMLSCDMPASTHAGELWLVARRRSARACRERVGLDLELDGSGSLDLDPTVKGPCLVLVIE